MERLNADSLLEILRRLDDSADVASCREVSKKFDLVSCSLSSINLRYPLEMYLKSRSNLSNSQQKKISFKKFFLNFLSKLREVESVCISTEIPNKHVMLLADHVNDLYLSDRDFILEWLPRVSKTLKSLSISDFALRSFASQSNLVQLVSLYCSKLLELKIKSVWLSLDNLNPMTSLTSLSLEHIRLDEDLNVLNHCFPNLQVLDIISFLGSNPLKIHLLNLKTLHFTMYNTDVPAPSSLTVITPNLITLRLECGWTTTLHIEAPMLLNFHLSFDNADGFTAEKFENLKNLSLESYHFGSLLFRFPITETVENLTIASLNGPPLDSENTKFTFGKLFSVFPNLISLCLKEGAWSELEVRYNPLGWEPWDGRNGFKMFCAYMLLVDPSTTFTHVSVLLNHCTGLSEVSFLIHRAVEDNVLKSFILKCMLCWPRLKWRWGMWEEGLKDSWISISSDSTSTIC